GRNPATPLHLCTTASSAVRQQSDSTPPLAVALPGWPGILSRRGSGEDDHPFVKVLAKRGNRGGSWSITVSEVEEPLKRKQYEEALRVLQVELCALQDWVKEKGLRVIVVFEGRDAAGKGGVIKAITDRVSPRVFRVVALPVPSDREKTQLYMQRYIQHFPAAGEIVIFDRSWYNRAGVEYVMGFCSKAQHQRFLKVCPEFELYVGDDGIKLIKYLLEVSVPEQKCRFETRITDPLRQWKLSPTDLCSRSRWFDYSRARDVMLD